MEISEKEKERNDAENEERKKETGMKRLTFKRVNGIKTGYWSPAKKEELIERLSQYEDLGYDPEDLKLILDMIIPDMMLESARRIKEEQERSE